jgi:ubiquinone/menaquinone biosynthesis C-methylase UbiE
MYRDLKDVLADQARGQGKNVLAISHSSNLLPILGLENARVQEANFPEHDILDLKDFGDASFDVVVSDQVLEHVEGNPQLAFDESFRVLKPGGFAVHTTTARRRITGGSRPMRCAI